MSKTQPAFLVKLDDGYIARDRDGPALLVVVKEQKKATRFTRKKAWSITKILGGLTHVTRLIRKARTLHLKAPPQGFARSWWKCRRCGRVMQYIHQPHSLANPIITTSCGHGFAERDYGCDTIPEAEALAELRKKWDRVVVEGVEEPKGDEEPKVT